MPANAFGYEYKATPLKVSEKAPKFLVDDLDTKLSKDGGSLDVFVKGQTDLVQVCESNKNKCGKAYMLELAAQGRVTANSLMDDTRVNGDYGGDFTGPTMMAEAAPLFNEAAAANKKLASIASDLGVSVQELIDCKDLQALIKSKIPDESNPDASKKEE